MLVRGFARKYLNGVGNGAGSVAIAVLRVDGIDENDEQEDGETMDQAEEKQGPAGSPAARNTRSFEDGCIKRADFADSSAGTDVT